jgi:hypothetical protein
MLSSHLHLGLPSGLLPSGLPTKMLYAPDHPNNTGRRVQTMQLLIMQFSPTSLHLIPLGSKYSPSTLFSNTLNLCSSLNVRDKVSHPYKITGKIIVLYISLTGYLFIYTSPEITNDTFLSNARVYIQKFPYELSIILKALPQERGVHVNHVSLANTLKKQFLNCVNFVVRMCCVVTCDCASWNMKYGVYTQLPKFSRPCLGIWLKFLSKSRSATELT